MTAVRAQRRKYHVIYKTTCLVTGKWYIGMHVWNAELMAVADRKAPQCQKSKRRHNQLAHVEGPCLKPTVQLSASQRSAPCASIAVKKLH